MSNFQVFYNMKSSRFFHSSKESYPTVEEIILSDDYVFMGIIEAMDIDHVFHICNVDHPEELVEKVETLAKKDPLHTEYPSLHTSMSVGDVVYDCESETMYFCDTCGWKELK